MRIVEPLNKLRIGEIHFMRWMICKPHFGINENLKGAMLTEKGIEEFWPTMVDRYSSIIQLRSALVRSGNQKREVLARGSRSGHIATSACLSHLTFH